MKNFLLLKILDPFKKLFTLVGIDYMVMRCILQAKLTMDSRRVPTALNNYKNDEKAQNKNRFLTSLFFYLFIGLINLPLILMGKQFMFQMSFVFGILMFMISTAMISDFSQVMLDINEKNILFSKPVNAKTINMAKFIHILYYLTCITLALSLPAMIAMFFTFGFLFLLIFIIELILINLIIIFFTSFLYLFILKFFDGEKLKDLISYIQIALSIFITVGFQLIGQSFNLMHVSLEMTYINSWWHYLLPPMWFAAPFELIFNHHFDLHFMIFTSLAILIPIIGIIAYIKLIPTFERNLQKLSNEGSNDQKVKHKKLSLQISKIICRNKEERIFYQFTRELMKNEREFKLRVYPSLGFALIMPFIFLFSINRITDFGEIANTKLYFYIYFCTLMLPASIMTLRFSANYNAAWIYKAAPIKDLKVIITGSLKAFIVRLLVPVFTIESIIFLFIFGLNIWIDLIIVLITCLIFANIVFKILDKALPFSQSSYEQSSTIGGLLFLIMLILGFFFLVHFSLSFINYASYIYALVLLIINYLLWKFNFNLTWEDLEDEFR